MHTFVLSLLVLLFPLQSALPDYWYEWTPTTGVTPSGYEQQGNVLPNFGEPQYPGGRYWHSMVDCTSSRWIDSNDLRACMFGGKILNTGFAACDLWTYTVSSRKWQFVPTVLAGRASVQQQLPCPGSRPSNGSLVLGSPYPGGRSEFGFFRLDSMKKGVKVGRVRIYGGYGLSCSEKQYGAAFLGDVWDLDLQTWKWTFRSVYEGSEFWWNRGDFGTIPGGRSSAAWWAIGNDLLVFGGDVYSSVSIDLAQLWRFVDQTGSWERIKTTGAMELKEVSGLACWKNGDESKFYFYGSTFNFQVARLGYLIFGERRWVQKTYAATPGFSNPVHPSWNQHAAACAMYRPVLRVDTAFLLGGWGIDVGHTASHSNVTAPLWSLNLVDDLWTFENITLDPYAFELNPDHPAIWRGDDSFPQARWGSALACLRNPTDFGRSIIVNYGGLSNALAGNDIYRADTWLGRSVHFGCPMGTSSFRCLKSLIPAIIIVAAVVASVSAIAAAVAVVLLFVLSWVFPKPAFAPAYVGERRPLLMGDDEYYGEDEESDDDPVLQFDSSLFSIPFDEIQVGRRIGSGGSEAIVFKANWAEREVAFKLFRISDMLSKRDRFAAFEREVGVLGSLSHPYILRFFGATLELPRVGILMEYCRNGDFSKYLATSRCNVTIRLRLLLQTALAMAFLHSRDVMHRDLKPENILISDDVEARVCDFGLSRILHDIDVDKTKAVGTSCYMAPELFEDSYDLKVDVYAFGILLYCILGNNFRPYGDTTHPEVKVSADPAYRPRLDMIPRPAELEWTVELMKACWSHFPVERPSFEDVVKIMKREAVNHESD